MVKVYRLICGLFVVLQLLCSLAEASDINILPKFGLVQKNEAELKADEKFIANIKEQYNGDIKKASEDIALNGWDYLRRNDYITAMRRFNQAWLLDNKNGTALWGMATIMMKIPSPTSMPNAIALFEEAQQVKKDDIDFDVDYTRALAFRALQLKDIDKMKFALKKYAEIYNKDKQHTLNLQNWAITLYQIGDYKQSWEKIKLAEEAPRKNELDKKFIEALESKMPRETINK